MERETISSESFSGPVVVVGVDGSEGSLAALDAALDEARRRDARLRLVTAWNVPVYVTGFAAPVMGVGELYVDAANAARSTAAHAQERLKLDPDVPVETWVREGHPPAVLISAAKDADLLVVGRRGHSRLSELLLGSTTRACVEHASCPVLVVPRLEPARAGAHSAQGHTAAT